MNKHSIFTTPAVSWLTKTSIESSNTVLTSKICISRNLQNFPFAHKASDDELSAIKYATLNLIPILETGTNLHFAYLELDTLTSNELQILYDKQLINKNCVQNPQYKLLFYSEDLSITILVNDIDHLKISCFSSDLNFAALLDQVLLIDDIIETQFELAFDEKLGYLTANPINLGTALKASTILHLPLLASSQQLAKIINIAPQIGINIQKLYPQSNTNNLFEISTLLTLGLKEQDIINQLNDILIKLITHEQEARLSLLDCTQDELEDRVWRSLAILKYARLISLEEVFDLLSELRLGLELNIINSISMTVLNSIFIISHNAYLKNLQEKDFISPEPLDKARATLIRQYLNDLNIAN